MQSNNETKNWLGPVALIWTAYAITCFAAIATTYSLGWHVTVTTGDPAAVAAVSVCALLPQGLLAPFGGVVADRFNRKRILLVCYVVIVIASLATAAVIATGHLSFPVILAFCLAVGVRNGFRDPAFNAMMPMLVPDSALVRINMLDNMLSAASMILAPALGIFLYESFGLQGPLFGLAIGSALSMLTLATVVVPTVTAQEIEGLAKTLLGGVTAIRSHAGMLALVIVFVLGLMEYGPFDNLLPLLISSVYGGDGYAASIVAGAFGVGLLVGSVVLMAVGDRVKLTHVIAGCALALGLAIIVVGILPGSFYGVLVVCVFIAGASCAGFAGPATTLLQRNCDAEHLGRVMGIFNAAMALGMPIGTALGGAFASLMGIQAFFVADGAFAIALALYAIRSRSIASLEKGACG